MSLVLNCLILGQDPSQMFSVEIPNNQNVSFLNALIKEKATPKLDHINAQGLRLWKVSISLDDGPEAVLDKLGSLPEESILLLHQKMAEVFTDVPAASHLHLIVKLPGISEPNCCVEGVPSIDMIVLEDVPQNISVEDLKELIKQKTAPTLDRISLSDLRLWSLSFPINDVRIPFRKPTTIGASLRPDRRLLDVFPYRLDLYHVHIVVGFPGSGSCAALSEARKKFCDHLESECPSVGGEPERFIENQKNNPDAYIPCNRPKGDDNPPTLLLSLLHPVFGQFIDDAENLVPTPEDISFGLSFATNMAEIYKDEDHRWSAVQALFYDHDIPIETAMLGDSYTTVGDLSCGKFRFLLVECNNEIVSESPGSEPYLQAALRYLEATRALATEHLNSVLPCIFVLVFGPFIAFAGAGWTDRPTVQMLSPALPCHYHDSNLKMESMLVRHLGALRRAIPSLEEYYREYDPNPSVPQRNPIYPYPNSFTLRYGTLKHFEYVSRAKNGRVYFGKCRDDFSSRICIKFASRYCKEAHELLAMDNFAPALHSVERLPGGVYMIVMADVSKDSYVSLSSLDLHAVNPDSRKALSENIRRCLQSFHSAGFVHGDVRSANIMVKLKQDRDELVDPSKFLLVGLDYCGKQGQVRYPVDPNFANVWRPEGAFGYAIVEAEHDNKMLDHIWDF